MSGRASADVSAARWRGVWRMHEEGDGNRAIARALGTDEKTVRYYLAKGRPHISDESLAWLAEQRKIQAAAAESRRLCAQRRREFDAGYLYVVEFDSGVVKVGKSGNPGWRIAQHAKAGVIRRSWSSSRHLDYSKAERRLTAFCSEHGTPHHGREYFRDIDFDLVRAYAERVVLDHRIRDEEAALSP